MSKHQEILDYLEGLPIGKRVSVRSISNHLRVSDGTAYRAIKEAENRGLVETKPRSGTVRIEKKVQVRLDKLTFAEIADITESEVVSGHAGLSHAFSKFYIGAMTLQHITRYLTTGGLLIVGDREDIQLLALENENAILVTGGFSVSENVQNLSRKKGIPVMVTAYDTFTVASIINQARSNVRIKTDIKTVAQVYSPRDEHSFLRSDMTVRDYQNMVKRTNRVRFPILDETDKVVGVVSMRDVANQSLTIPLTKVMSTNPTTTRLEISLAAVAQKMIFEDFDMLPVTDKDHRLLGVITRRQVMENLQEMNRGDLHTYSDQMVANLEQEKQKFSFVVEPAMIDNSGNLTHGVLTEILKEVTHRILAQKDQRNIIIEQIMIYFLQAVQIDDKLDVSPKIVASNRRSAHLDMEVALDHQIVCKAEIVTKIT
ncbi:CBS-HotDog domain-containing transcription factor SpxR [Streptococcus dentiloxodontae]